jgi:signal transduction histidine kinase/CheY-like chemotaxis protein
MYNEFQQQKMRIHKNFTIYQSIFGNSLTTAWWNYDFEQLKATAEGILGLTDTAGVLLVDTKSKEIFRGGNAPSISSNKADWKNQFYQEFTVAYDERTLGTLYLFSSQKIVFDQVKHNFLFILVNAVIKSIVLWVLFLWAFKKYLVKALDEFLLKMESTDFDNIDNKEQNNDANPHIGLESRELRRLDKVFTSLKQRLHGSKNKLMDLNSNLESMVEKRTCMLARQSSLLQAMSRQARIGAWELDFQSKILTWSSMTREIFEISDEFIVNDETTNKFYPADSLATLLKAHSNAISAGKSWSEEFIITTNKGNEVWITSTGEAEFEQGKCQRLFGSIQDINNEVTIKQDLLATQKKAVAADIAKSEFLASMSHEIRTPMNGIMGTLHLLLSSPLNDQQKQQAELSLSSAESLLCLLNEILDISKIESGKLKLEEIDFSLQELLHQQQNFWEASVEKRGLVLDLITRDLNHPYVNGDPTRVKQIISNLISNAEKFTTQGKITLKAHTSKVGDDITLFLSVSDTGVGIKEDKIDTIFDVFSQEDSSTTRKYGGTGLGLTIVRELAEMMQGSIRVKSKLGKGSTFVVELLFKPTVNPLTPSDEHGSIEPILQFSTTKKIGRILLVDDIEINQIIGEAMISASGHFCAIAKNGIEAINTLIDSEFEFTLILMDCQMPEKDGYEATADIRAGLAGKHYINIPIIALTANAMKGDKKKCIDAGMNDYLTKPFSPEELEKVLYNWL